MCWSQGRDAGVLGALCGHVRVSTRVPPLLEAALSCHLSGSVFLLPLSMAGCFWRAAALDAVLRRRGNLANNAGSTALLLPEPGTVQRERAPTDAPADGSHAPGRSASGTHAPPASPVLALRSGGAALVQVSVQLRTGRLLLRPGDDAELRPDLELIMQRVRSAPPCWGHLLLTVCTFSNMCEAAIEAAMAARLGVHYVFCGLSMLGISQGGNKASFRP